MSRLELPVAGAGTVTIEVGFEPAVIVPTPAPTPAPAPAPAPEPEPEPEIPPIVIPPTGFLTRPNGVQNMYEKEPGEWWTRSDYPTLNAAVLQFLLGQLTPWDLVRVSFLRWTNIVIGSNYNFKPWRVWPVGQVGGYPNQVAGTQTDGSIILFSTEKIDGVTGTGRFYGKWPAPTGTWVPEVWEWAASSGLGKADGRAYLKVGDKTMVDSQTWISRNATYPGIPNYLCLQGVNSPQAGNANRQKLPSDAFMRFKDVKIQIVKR